MAFTEIDDPSAYFKCHLYTGTGSSNAQTFADTDTDMQPDMVWIKSRSDGFNHMLYDAARGVQKHIKPDTTAAEATDSNSLTAFGSDGFTVGSNSDLNNSSDTYVAWCWKANGSGAANSEGNTTTTKTSANTTSGFSIITYDGDGAAATLGHGLGSVVNLIIQKNIDDTENWHVYHHKNTSAPETDYLTLNTTNATDDQSSRWNDTAPTSTLITIGTDSSVSQSGESMVMYAWSEKQGFSKFGSYIGNANANGDFIYLGFRPALVIVKKASATDNWFMFDNKREGYNALNDALRPNLANAELNLSGVGMDLLSNGFKLRSGDDDLNDSNTFIYMAWAEAPFVNSNGVPCNAR